MDGTIPESIVKVGASAGAGMLGAGAVFRWLIGRVISDYDMRLRRLEDRVDAGIAFQSHVERQLGIVITKLDGIISTNERQDKNIEKLFDKTDRLSDTQHINLQKL